MSFLLDTNICSAHMKRPGGLAHRLIQHSGRLWMPNIVLADFTPVRICSTGQDTILAGIQDLRQDVGLIDFDETCALRLGPPSWSSKSPRRPATSTSGQSSVTTNVLACSKTLSRAFDPDEIHWFFRRDRGARSANSGRRRTVLFRCVSRVVARSSCTPERRSPPAAHRRRHGLRHARSCGVCRPSRRGPDVSLTKRSVDHLSRRTDCRPAHNHGPITTRRGASSLAPVGPPPSHAATTGFGMPGDRVAPTQPAYTGPPNPPEAHPQGRLNQYVSTLRPANPLSRTYCRCMPYR